MTMPKVSVIIPTYNASDYIEETINSILKQDYKDFEIIVVDDCSTDNTKKKVCEYNLEEIKFISLEQNHGGPSRPRNIGIKNARGKYISFCDSDDLYCLDRISDALELLENRPDLGLVFTRVTKFDDCTGRVIGDFHDGYEKFISLPKRKVKEKNFIIKSSDAYHCLFFENFIMPSSVTVPKEVFKKVGLFDEELKNSDDRDMWFRITKEFPIGFINSVGFKYRIRSGSISSRGPVLYYYRICNFKKRLNEKLLSNTKAQCNKLISQNYYSIGYYFQRNKRMKISMKYYLQSLRYRINYFAIKGLLISFLPLRIYLKVKSCFH